jgi:hypothetical protein
MTSVTELLAGLAGDIKASAAELLLSHSGLKRRTPNRRVVHFSSYHSWEPLGEEGSRLRSKVRDDYMRFHAVLKTLLRTQPSGVLQKVSQADMSANRVLNQQGTTRTSSVEEARQRFDAALDAQMALLSGLYDGAEGEHVYVPDTNALLYKPRLEDWKFDGSARFVLLLTPTVLSELDQLKVTHRVESVREKAEKLVRQLFEYRRRGSLSDGVVLRRDSHLLKTLAVEPNFGETLPWLDKANNDDRILAGFIEVMRQHPRCQVTLVTRDINLANKADYARVPCVHPPEPSEPEDRARQGARR